MAQFGPRTFRMIAKNDDIEWRIIFAKVINEVSQFLIAIGPIPRTHASKANRDGKGMRPASDMVSQHLPIAVAISKSNNPAALPGEA